MGPLHSGTHRVVPHPESSLRAIGTDRPPQPSVINPPAHLSYEDGQYLIGIGPGALAPDPSDEVVLVVDDGVLFFELRAVYVRGVARSVSTFPQEGLRWAEVEPCRASSWDYGRMRWKRDTR